MAFYYLETSALVKLYVREDGTEHMLRLVDASALNRFAILAITQAEFRSAIRRRERAGDLDGSVAAEVLERFDLHLGTMYVRQGMSDAVIDLSCAMIDRYPLRAYDALQLAGCLVIKESAPSPPVFVCADHQLLQAAETEGLVWLDPTALT
ncbi:MAG: type II toxin-antitoxin system VapC family toxin [Chloroflexi bacterium]|nr:type II toxin-antitoxin system VapC family toxin [Chloroflexota bacterium]